MSIKIPNDFPSTDPIALALYLRHERNRAMGAYMKAAAVGGIKLARRAFSSVVHRAAHA